MTIIKSLLVITILCASCAPMTEIEWKQKKMMKADRKMMRKVKCVRKFSR
jgi:hypothetical protein